MRFVGLLLFVAVLVLLPLLLFNMVVMGQLESLRVTYGRGEHLAQAIADGR